MKKSLFIVMVILMGALLFYFSCGENGVKPKLTAKELIDQGWQKFAAGNSTGAGSDFSAALSLASAKDDSSGAFLGLGWAELRQSHAGLAEKSLVNYLSLSPGSTDGRAGLALAYLGLEKFQSAIDTANVVLASSPSWSFGHDNSIDYWELRLLLAQSYYALAEFNTSLEIVQEYFEPDFNPDTNTPEGRKSLADMIQSLWERVT